MAAQPSSQRDLDKPRYPIGSVDRVLQLLLLFRHRPTIRVADAAAELGVAASTAHRLLAMLQVHGFIAQDHKTRQYVPGPAIIELGNAVHRHGDLTELGQGAAEELQARVLETANVSVLQHTSVVFIAGSECEQALRIANQTGRRIAAFHSAPGKVMLAGLPIERLRSLYPDDELTDPFNGVTMRRVALEAELVEVRSLGYATNDVPNTSAVGEFLSMAVAVHRNGEIVMALSVAAPAQRAMDSWRKLAVTELKRTAKALESQFK
jgi:IclR family acetate operon transcriptional repressor